MPFFDTISQTKTTIMQSIYTSRQVFNVFKSLIVLCLFCALSVKINAQTYVNGNLSTGVTASTGETAPNCATWSEVQLGNVNAGYAASVFDGFTVADDFTVTGGTWNISKFTFYAYSTGYAGTVSPFDSVRLRIYNTDPSTGTATPIFGDLVANRFISSSFSGMYRIFNGAADLTRKIWKIEAAASVSLAPGTYWVEWQVGTDLVSNFSPASTVVGTVTQPGNNGLQNTLPATWIPLVDGPTETDPQDMPFMISYSTSPCSGTPAPGNTIYTDADNCTSATPSTCPGISFTLSAQNATAGSGLTYQWQSSTNGVTFTNIPGATNNTLVTSLTTSDLYYQLIVTCAGSPGTSTPIHVLLNAIEDCYCAPTSDCTDGDIITNVTLGTLNNTSDCGVNGFTFYGSDPTIPVPNVTRGTANSISVTAGGGTFSETVAAWIDYDHNGSFDPSEFTFIGGTVGGTLTANINVPGTAPLGPARMRVRVEFFDALTDADACLLYDFGETEDYMVNIVDCDPTAITTQPVSSSATCGQDTVFSVVATGTGLTYQWQQRVSAAAPWTDVVDGPGFSGATTGALVLTGVTSTMNGYEYRVVITSACGAVVNSNAASLSVNQLIVEVLPTSVNVCGPVTTPILLTISSQNPNGIVTTETTTYASGAINLAIPDIADETGVTNTITVPPLPAGAVITGASVVLNATHTWVGDLMFALKAPNGNTLSLDYALNGTGGTVASTGFTNTEISSAAPLTNTLDLGTSPFTDVFTPDAFPDPGAGFFPVAPTSLAVSPTDPIVTSFDGLYSVPSGNWTIGVYDYFAGDAGTLLNWTLKLTYTYSTATPYNGVWTPATGLFSNPAGTIPYNGTPTDTVYALPTTSTLYTVTPVTATCTGVPVSIPVTVGEPIGTLTNPVDVTICENNNASFSVSASSGTGITYLWQVSTDGGTVYTDVVDGGVYSGATTETLSLTNVPLSFNGYKYKVTLSVASCSSTATSTVATLTVNAGGVLITAQPADATVNAGNDHTFFVTATGTALTYQWQVSTTGCGGTFADIPGATGNSFVIAVATAAQNGYGYQCIVTGPCGPVVTNCATLTVITNTCPEITTQPSDVSVCAGSDATFSVITPTPGVSFQWQVSTGGPFTNIPGATTETYTITGVTGALSGNLYQVVITTADCPNPLTSTAVTLTVAAAPVITTQPIDVLACSGEAVYFSVASSGAGVTYQWQVSTGGPFSDIAGETSDTLHINPATPTLSGNIYQVVLTIPGCAGTTTSTAVQLTVNEAPFITIQPTGTSVCEGNAVTFNSDATGSGITFQWQVSTDGGTTFTDIAGATTQAYVVNPATAAMNNNQYHVVVTGVCSPAAISDAATLLVTAAPVITTQPVDASTCTNGSGTFNVVVSGSDISYQWQISTVGCAGPWNNIGAATSPTFVTPLVTATTYYRCRIENLCIAAPIYSNCATLTVSGAIDITTQPNTQDVCSGSDAVFSVVVSTADVTYQWQVNDGSGFTDIAGATAATLTVPAVTAAMNGNQYQVLVASATCPGSVTSTIALLNVNEAPAITSTPQTISACPGVAATFNATATGTGITYQWQVSTDGGTSYSAIPGATGATYVIPAVTTAMNNNLYQVVVTGICPPVAISTPDTLLVTSGPTITTQPAAATVCAGSDYTFSVTATGSALTYQWQVSTTGCAGVFSNVAGATTSSLVLTGITAAQNNNAYQCVITDGCGNTAIITDCAVLTVSGSIDITTQPVNQVACSGTDATFTVVTGAGINYQWQVNSGAGFTDIAGATSATLTLPAVTVALNGNQYQVILTSATCPNPTTSAVVTLTVNEAPAITTQPIDVSLCEGGAATFAATATGTGISYQWQVSTNGGASFTDIPGATSATYIESAVTAAMNNNQYQVVVTGTCPPAAISNAAILTVNENTAITTQPSNQAICAGSDVTYTVVATGSALTYQWQVSPTGCAGTFTDIIGETNATLSVTAITASQNGAAYHCIVTGGCGTVTSDCATLTVEELSVATAPADQTACTGTTATFTVVANGPGVIYQWQVSTDGGTTFTDISGANTATLTVTGVTAADNGNQYQVMVSTVFCPSITTVPAILTVAGPLSITTQPVDVAVCENGSATFNVTADNGGSTTGITYQWQVSTDGGATFTDMAGETNSSLTLSPVTNDMTTNSYHVVIANSPCPGTVTSNDVTVSINPSPVITATADASSVCSGADVHLTASGAGAGGSYTWTPGGLNGDAVTVQPTVDPSNPGSPNTIAYTVTGVDANACSGTATVNVVANPLPVVTITASPSNTSLLPGQSTTLTATVNPAGTYEYSWLKDGIAISATSSSLTVSNGQAGLYSVIASGTGGICPSESNKIAITDSVISNFIIYPNPNNGQFSIVYPELPAKSSVAVYDAHGSRVFVKANLAQNQVVQVDMRPIASGVYMIVVYNGAEERLATAKIVVQ